MGEIPQRKNGESKGCSVEQLAEQYLERLRNGEQPRIEEYIARYPELEDEIRDVFDTLAMLEDVARDHHNDIESDVFPAPAAIPSNIGEYRIIRELGRGGMGVVYEAEHATMRRRVALKVLHGGATSKGNSLERFVREARSAGRLHHTKYRSRIRGW